MRFPISGVLMVSIGGILLMIYIMFNYAFMDMRDSLWASANDTLSGSHLSNFGDLMVQLPQAFGIACAMCFGVGIAIFIVDAMRDPRDQW